MVLDWDAIVDAELGRDHDHADDAEAETAVSECYSSNHQITSEPSASPAPANKLRLVKARSKGRSRPRSAKPPLPPRPNLTKATTKTNKANASTAEPDSQRRRSEGSVAGDDSASFSWWERRLNHKHDLNEFQQLEHELEPLQVSQASPLPLNSASTKAVDPSETYVASQTHTNEAQGVDRWAYPSQQSREESNHYNQAHQQSSSMSMSMPAVSSLSRSVDELRLEHVHEPYPILTDKHEVETSSTETPGSPAPVSALVKRFFDVPSNRRVLRKEGAASSSSSKHALDRSFSPEDLADEGFLGIQEPSRSPEQRMCSKCVDLAVVKAQLQEALSSVEHFRKAAEDAEKAHQNETRKGDKLRQELKQAETQLNNAGDDVQRQRKALEEERRKHIKEMRRQRLELDKHVKEVMKAHLPDRSMRQQLEQSELRCREIEARSETVLSKAKAEIHRLQREVESVRASNQELSRDLKASEQRSVELQKNVRIVQDELLDLRHREKAPPSLHHDIRSSGSKPSLKTTNVLDMFPQQQRLQQVHERRHLEDTDLQTPPRSNHPIGQSLQKTDSPQPITRTASQTMPSPSGAAEGSSRDGRRYPQRIVQPGGKIETRHADGSRVIEFPNKTKKHIAENGDVDISFSNGDRKKIRSDREEYYYASSDILHVSYRDGVQTFQFSNRQKETHYPDGSKEIVFADNIVKRVFPNGDEQSVFPNGLIQRVCGGKVSIEYPPTQQPPRPGSQYVQTMSRSRPG